jgi:hypothetical protein
MTAAHGEALRTQDSALRTQSRRPAGSNFPSSMLPRAFMAFTQHGFERFVADNFDSEETVMIVLALRGAPPLGIGDLLDRLERHFGLLPTEQRRLDEKRIELRLRDLIARELVHLGADGKYRSRAEEAGLAEMIDRLSTEFTTSRRDLNRLIYATSSRARRLAEAFRL